MSISHTFSIRAKDTSLRWLIQQRRSNPGSRHESEDLCGKNFHGLTISPETKACLPSENRLIPKAEIVSLQPLIFRGELVSLKEGNGFFSLKPLGFQRSGISSSVTMFKLGCRISYGEASDIDDATLLNRCPPLQFATIQLAR